MDFSETIKQIRTASTPPPNSIKEEDRQELVKVCDELRASLEGPMDLAMRVLLSPYQATALRLGVDMGLFDAAAKVCAEGNESVSVEQLASETGADQLLITRILRLLTGMGVFKEVAKDRFRPTSISNAYVSHSPLSAGIIHIFENMIPLAHLPDYFAERGWKNPEDTFNGPFQFARGTDMHAFDYLGTKPRLQQAFNTTMALSLRRRGPSWHTFYPVKERFGNASPTETLLVDVGGGQGADLVAFRKAHPEITGKLILQDLPAVISSVDAEALSASSIEAIPHNFFHPQPVKNARVYYLRTVLHDWPDAKALEILVHIKDAMGPQGVLLIEENILPEEGVTLEAAYADIIMMIGFASMERRLAEWIKLLGKAGLRLEKLWKPEGQGSSGNTALLEAVMDNGQSTKAEEGGA